MKENHQFLTGIIIGALAGSALALYLSSEKGKKWMLALNEHTNTLKDELLEEVNKTDETLQNMLTKAKQLVTDLEQKLSEVKIN